MAMGSTGTVNMSVQMFKDIVTAVEAYEGKAAGLKTELEGVINGLVGIISHVGELKEKIDKQILVTKEKTGGSRVELRV